MTPALIAIVIVTGLLALLPARRLARRVRPPWFVLAWYVATWGVLLLVVLVPPARRLAILPLPVLGIGPWIDVGAGVDRVLRRPRHLRRPPPRNVTPPEAGGPWRP